MFNSKVVLARILGHKWQKPTCTGLRELKSSDNWEVQEQNPLLVQLGPESEMRQQDLASPPLILPSFVPALFPGSVLKTSNHRSSLHPAFQHPCLDQSRSRALPWTNHGSQGDRGLWLARPHSKEFITQQHLYVKIRWENKDVKLHTLWSHGCKKKKKKKYSPQIWPYVGMTSRKKANAHTGSGWGWALASLMTFPHPPHCPNFL